MKKIGRIIFALLIVAAVVVGTYVYNNNVAPSPDDPSELSSIADPQSSEESSIVDPQSEESSDVDPDAVDYYFRSEKLLKQHYEKHGIDMGFPSAEAYEKAASDVVNDPNALHKTEKEDGDFVYYIESTNEFVVLSKDGYLRTYFLPDAGKKYYDKQ